MSNTPHEQSLLEALGMNDLEPEEQEEMLLDLNELIFKGSFLRIIEQMDDDTKAAFDALMETDPDEDKIQAFLEKNAPNADQAVTDTVEELRNDILSVTGASQD